MFQKILLVENQHANLIRYGCFFSATLKNNFKIFHMNGTSLSQYPLSLLKQDQDVRFQILFNQRNTKHSWITVVVLHAIPLLLATSKYTKRRCQLSRFRMRLRFSQPLDFIGQFKRKPLSKVFRRPQVVVKANPKLYASSKAM